MPDPLTIGEDIIDLQRLEPLDSMDTYLSQTIPPNLFGEKTNPKRSRRIKRPIEARSVCQSTIRAFHVERTIIIPKNYSEVLV